MNEPTLLYSGKCKVKELRKEMRKATQKAWDEMLSKAWEEVDRWKNERNRI